MIVEEKKVHDKQCARHPDKGFCFGARCMAWRWADEEGTDPTTKWPYVKRSTTHGYCGLAGRP